MSLSIGTVYSKPWFWKKGTRVSVIGDLLAIKIGGNPENKKALKNSNKIKSTKYNLISFLPQNLLEQFRRIANFYFLIMSVIAVIIDSPVSPLTSLVPLVFVIAVTATKQAYEDFLRFKADNMVNLSLVTVIKNGVAVDIRSQDIMPGDLVKIPRDCDVPCDLVLLKSSDPNGKCHITTANLDGESNLKTLSIPKGLPNIETNRLHTLGDIECELPRTDLYTFNGKIILSPTVIARNINGNAINNVLPLMADNLMLRGSRIKNTEWGIGCAVYTGQSTKLALNSKITRNKISSTEEFINKFLIFFLMILISSVLICFFMKRYYDLAYVQHNAYLGDIIETAQVTQFLQDFFSFLILFNYLIPISLYVTIEMHKFLGSFFMEWDPELYCEELDQPFVVNTSDLNEELGQVNLLFSDKTGTLTKNEMIFQQCSINGEMYVHKGLGIRNMRTYQTQKIHEFKEDVDNFFEALSICHTVQIAGDKNPFNSNIRTSESHFDCSRINEEEHNQSMDSDIDDPDFIDIQPRESTMSNESRPLSLLEYERISMKNNLTRRTMGDLNPLLNRTRYDNVDIKINFLGKTQTQNTNNVNELPDSSALTLNDKVIKRPISEILNQPSRVLELREGTSNKAPTSNFNESEEYEMQIKECEKPAYVNGTGSLKRPRLSADHLSHRRTQSYAAASAIPSVTIRLSPVVKEVSFFGRDSMSHTREYYAAPSYTEASLLERKESTMRRGAVKSVIELLDYQASSPDEKALVEACARLGYVYTGDKNEILTVELKTDFYRGKRISYETVDEAVHRLKSDNSNISQYQRLGILEFSSDRKRMSVIVKNEEGQIWLYTKGAESHVLPLCTEAPKLLLKMTQQHVNEFAKQGLRTLAVARKKLTIAEFSTYNRELHNANNSLTNRKRLVEECQRKLETKLELLGATAVEDALQDNVKDTIESLRLAGIKVWVLTGDKIETALNIALACGHIPENAYKYFITGCVTEIQVHEHLNIFNGEMIRNPDEQFTLLIDGVSLGIALKAAGERFRDIAIKCRAVLCCRLSPLQKCEVVQLMKTCEDKPITAAIGDGANDVAMIQEAHVGLGIVGKEGRQAARCADYAFANFSMIKKVLLVHGHFYSQRLAILVLYFFYKNLVFMSIQFFFQMNSMFSSQSIYDSLFLTVYNVFYTALPILILSLTEKIFPESTLLCNPKLYNNITNNKALRWKYFCGWMLLGCYHGIIIYVFSYVIWATNPTISTTPHNSNLSCFGTFMIHVVVVLVNLKLWMEASYQTWVFIVTIWISIMGFVITTVIYGIFNLEDGDMLSVYWNLLSSITFWLLSLIIIITALLPDFTMKAFKALNLNLNFSKYFPGLRK